MLIFDSTPQPLALDSLQAPVVSDHFWVLDLGLQDFTLAPLTMLEEIVCPTVVLKVSGFPFAIPVPSSWHLLVYDEETMQLDTVQLAEAPGRDFTAFVGGPNISKITPGTVSVMDYFPEFTNVSPSLNKHQMLCCPISNDAWISVSPSDAYARHLKNACAGDLINYN